MAALPIVLSLAQYGAPAVISALLHPFGYAKVLIQVGHEPLAPEKTTSVFFGEEVYEYPNIFRYIGHIYSVDGITGLYRGVIPRIISGTMINLAQFSAEDDIDREEPEEDGVVPWLKVFAKEAADDAMHRCYGVLLSHPFHVIMVRNMVQFIGRETKYDSVFSSVSEIYDHDGFLGYFAGLIPRLLGDVITVWMTNFLTKTVNKYFMHDKEMKGYTSSICNFVVTNFTYPFTLVGNVMAVSNSGLAAGEHPLMPPYTNWINCLISLALEGELNRGSSAFWRIYKPRPTVLSAFIMADSIPRNPISNKIIQNVYIGHFHRGISSW